MKSKRLTKINHTEGFKNPEDSVLVHGKFFNDLKDDFDALRPSDTIVKADTILPATANGTISIQPTANVVEKTIEVNLSAANLIAMNATPVEVVPAPGAGYALCFKSAVLIYDSTATAFTGGGVITINYGSGGAAQSANLAASFLTGAGDKVFNLEKLNAAGGLTMPVNTSLVITNASGAFATGTGVCRLQITYTIHKTNL